MPELARREQVQIGRTLRLDRRSALDLLRDLARDRAVLADLRRLWAKESAATTLCFASDEQVLTQLADRIAVGSLVIARVPPPLPRTPPPGEGDVDGAVELVESEAANEPPPDKGAIMNPRWSVDRVEVGAELDAAFTYVGCDLGQPVTLTIFEVNANGTKKEVDKIEVSVPEKSGDHKAKWKRDPDKAAADLKEDEAEGDTGPLEYRFSVEAEGVGKTGLSDKLWLTNTVTINLNDDEGKPLEGSRIVVLKDYEREQRAESKDGKAEFKKVLVGPVEVRLAKPRFTNLGWSEPKVKVGEEVNAVFNYQDAIKDMKVSVVIHEFNIDGTSTERERAEVTLPAENGEAKAPFSRTEDEAQEDMAADEAEGDTGPVEYRYYVEMEDGTGSEASEPLWLTHTVSIKLENTEEGEPFPDGLELMLIGADGTEHRAALSGGEAKFEGVVCGPMTVKLAPKEEDA